MSKNNLRLPTTGTIGNIGTRNNLPSQTQQMTFTVEELLTKIDQVKSAGFGPEPALFEMVVSSGAGAEKDNRRGQSKRSPCQKRTY